MRKVYLLLVASLLLSLNLFAQDGSKDQILTTGHDFIGQGVVAADGNNQICVFCHIPHETATSNYVLLWNHQFGATTTYTPYSSVSLDSSPATLDSSSATQQKSEAFYSLACLSCHDGQTAINTVYRVPMGYTNPEGAPGLINGPAVLAGSLGITPGEYVIGTDLSNDHPVNFAYSATLATTDAGLYNPATGAAVSTGGTATAGLWAIRSLTRGAHGEVTQPVLFNGTVQCATCHNPHNETNDAFLRVDNAGSALCLKCHATT